MGARQPTRRMLTRSFAPAGRRAVSHAAKRRAACSVGRVDLERLERGRLAADRGHVEELRHQAPPSRQAGPAKITERRQVEQRDRGAPIVGGIGGVEDHAIDERRQVSKDAAVGVFPTRHHAAAGRLDSRQRCDGVV